MFYRLPLTILCSALLLSAACDRAPGAGDESAAAEVAPIAGMYEVTGSTVDTKTGAEREISGSVILAEEGSSYTATFHLTTIFEGEEGVLPADVIGKGSGRIEDRTLRGTAETQLVISSVPGIDPGFAFIPRTTTTRLESKSLTTIAADGSVVIEIENQGATGEVYTPSRTTLRGIRIGAPGIAGLKGEPPPVAAGPPKAGD
jgi:hypothetical protein